MIRYKDMTATGHALIGTIIAAKIGNPYIALPIAFFSHIVADLIPHWDAGTHGRSKKKEQLRFEAGIDVIVGFVASYTLVFMVFPGTNLIYVFINIIVAQGIDWLTAPYYMFNFKMQPFKFFHRISSITNTKLDKPWGIISQALVILILLFISVLFI